MLLHADAPKSVLEASRAAEISRASGHQADPRCGPLLFPAKMRGVANIWEYGGPFGEKVNAQLIFILRYFLPHFVPNRAILEAR